MLNLFSKKTPQRREDERNSKKISKDEISIPFNFKHIYHAGTSGYRTEDSSSDGMVNLNNFLERAGVSQKHLNNRESRTFIFDFIRRNNVEDTIKEEISDQSRRYALRPVPLPSLAKTTSYRLTPTVDQRPLTLKTKTRSDTSVLPPAVPPPPPPPPIMENVPRPPPPPPMNVDVSKPVVNKPVADEPRNALMESIRKGTQLRPVDQSQVNESVANSGSEDSRSDLLSAIRQGVELRPAASRQLSAQHESSGGGTDALADALRRALADRFLAIRDSDDEWDSSDNDDEWDN